MGERRTMRFSIGLPTDRVDRAEEFVTGEAVATCAREAETLGFDACFVTDHPAPDTKWVETGGHHALDPFVALSFAAAATSTLRLQTHIIVLAYRNPFLAAKSILSLDVLSGGRVTLGVATGYLKWEFAALGVDFEERNALTDEAIDVIRAVLSRDDVAWEGTHFTSRGTTMRPRPVQQPQPPIWVGGNSRAAIRRAVARGEGWVPFPNPAAYSRAVRTPELSTFEDLEARLAMLRAEMETAGRTEPLDICFAPFSVAALGGGGSFESRAVVDEVRRLEELGITWCAISAPHADTRQAYLDEVRRFADEVIGPLRG